MPKHTYINNPNNLFEDDEPSEPNTGFRARIPHRRSVRTRPYSDNKLNQNHSQQSIEEKPKDIQDKILESTANGVAMLHESVDIAIKASKELDRQGSILQKTYKRLDNIKSDLKVGQRKIKGIKSIFYALKNHVSSTSSGTTYSFANRALPNESSSTKKERNKLPHTKKITGKKRSNSFQHEQNLNKPTQTPVRTSNFYYQGVASSASNNQSFDDTINNKLQDMVEAIDLLKDISYDLGGEIDEQNVLIDAITNKVEVVDINVGIQTRQMEKMLKK